MKKVTLSHYTIQALRDEGASHVFMIPGGYVDNFSEALVDVEGIEAVVCASEAGAAYMADGFARSAGRFSICMGISGPGASNMITGLSASQADQVPVLAITGDSPLVWRNRQSIQDPGAMGLKTTQLLSLVSDVQEEAVDAYALDNHIRNLMPVLKGQKQGVGHLSLPLDIQLEEKPFTYNASSVESTDGTDCDTAGLTQAMHCISRCKNVVILAGSGVRKSGAFNQLQAFAENYSIPVATTMSAKGDFPEDHPLSMGVFGWAGSALANETLMSKEIDCLIVIGSRLGQINTMNWSPALAEKRALIQIDIDARHLNKTYRADHAIVSDACQALRYMASGDCSAQIVQRLDANKHAREAWLEAKKQLLPSYYDKATRSSNAIPLHPARAIAELSKIAPENTQLFVDNGAHTFFATHHWQISRPHQYFNIIKYSGAMGWAIAASIGAKIARPDQSCIAVVGDGCMLMQGIEIQTAARYNLRGMIFVVLNNKAHGNPKLRTEGFTEEAGALTDIVDHDWAGFAQSLGVKGISVSDPYQLSAVYDEAMQAAGPVLIDVKCGLYPTPTKVFDETFMEEFNRYIGRDSRTQKLLEEVNYDSSKSEPSFN
ncbi:MAG: thiamine pyrophosphate-binding protein [Oleiphilaceae bacterium]|nr:thiamine pyrophosphate-binding protein [Oleiphilaceae bacterium]